MRISLWVMPWVLAGLPQGFAAGAPEGGGEPAEAAALAAEVERRYLRLVTLMGQLLEAAEELEESGRLQAALERARELRLAERLEGIRRLLEGRALEEALAEEIAAEKDLNRILRVLRGEDEVERFKEERRELERAREELRRLERIRRDQEENLEATKRLLEAGGAGEDEAPERAGELARKEEDLARRTARLRRALERLAEAARERQARQGEQGERREQGGQGAQRGPGGGRQDREGRPGQGSQQGEQSPPGEEARQGPQRPEGERGSSGRRGEASRSLERAERRQGEAARRLEARNLGGSREDQEEALRELQQALESLESEEAEREARLREEAARRIAGRLYAMLAEQQLVSSETEALEREHSPAALAESRPRGGDGAREAGGAPEPRDSTEPRGTVLEPEGGLPPPAPSPDSGEGGGEGREEAKARAARSLARRERGLARDAGEVLEILEEEGSSVVAPAIIERIRDDLENVAGRLDAAETGELTQMLQGDIETSLRELIEALKPPRRRGGEGGGGAGSGSGQSQRRQLITAVNELRMLVSAQRRIRTRTARLESLGLLPEGASGAGGGGDVRGPGGGPEPGGGPGRAGSEREAGPPGGGSPGEQAGRLARAQADLAELTEAFIARYPEIDLFLLGVREPAAEGPGDHGGEGDHGE